MTPSIPALQTEAVVPELIDAGYALIARYWWVFVLIGLAWYLRWYGKAMRNDVDAAPLVGVGSMLEHAYYLARSAVPAIVLLGAVAIAGVAWMFNIGTGLIVGLGVGDPTTYAVVIAGTLAMLDPFGVPGTTLETVVFAFIATFLVMMLLSKAKGPLMRWGREMEEADGDDAEAFSTTAVIAVIGGIVAAGVGMLGLGTVLNMADGGLSTGQMATLESWAPMIAIIALVLIGVFLMDDLLGQDADDDTGEFQFDNADSDSSGDDDGGPMDFLYAYRDDD